MKISLAHLRQRSTTGDWIDFAVFDAKATNGDNDSLLQQLTHAAQKNGLKIDQSALAFSANGRIQFFGDKNLVAFLAKNGVPRWTHSIEL